MDRTQQLKNIKLRLGISDDSQDAVLESLFEQYISEAKNICNRKDEPEALIFIVQDIVAGVYNGRGGEGFSSSSAGGQSYQQLDMYETMRKQLINSGLRKLRI